MFYIHSTSLAGMHACVHMYRQGLSMNLDLGWWPESPFSVGITDVRDHNCLLLLLLFYVGSGDLSSGSHAYADSKRSLPAEPPPSTHSTCSMPTTPPSNERLLQWATSHQCGNQRGKRCLEEESWAYAGRQARRQPGVELDGQVSMEAR